MLSSGEIVSLGIPQSSLVSAFAIAPAGGLVTPAGNPLAAGQSGYVGECASKGFQHHPGAARLPAAPFGTPAMYLAGRGRGRSGTTGSRGVGGAGKPGAPGGARPKGKQPFSPQTIDAILRRMEHSPEWYEPMAALSLLTTVMITQQLDRAHEDRALDILWKFVLRPYRSGPPS